VRWSSGTARADQRDEGARLDRERHVVQHRAAALAVAGGRGLERGQRDLVGGGVENETPSTSTRTGPGGTGPGVGRLGHERLEVEHLEDPLERDQGGEDVDPHVGDGGERAVEPARER
jgi:hypothetical protein